ncbi:MAG: hypothetical protein ACLFPL_05510 [Candidatus Nanoarchaeia archaeon]
MNQFYEDVFQFMEQEVSRRKPEISFKREFIDIINENNNSFLPKYGYLVLPISRILHSPKLDNLHGGILIISVSNRDGLCVYNQKSKILRILMANNSLLKSSLKILLSYENIKNDRLFGRVPILYSNEKVGLIKGKDCESIRSYEELFNQLAQQN